jgi:hypothetical protein
MNFENQDEMFGESSLLPALKVKCQSIAEDTPAY